MDAVLPILITSSISVTSDTEISRSNSIKRNVGGAYLLPQADAVGRGFQSVSAANTLI